MGKGKKEEEEEVAKVEVAMAMAMAMGMEMGMVGTVEMGLVGLELVVGDFLAGEGEATRRRRKQLMRNFTKQQRTSQLTTCFFILIRKKLSGSAWIEREADVRTHSSDTFVETQEKLFVILLSNFEHLPLYLCSRFKRLFFLGFLLLLQILFVCFYMFLLIFGVNVIPVRLDRLPLFMRGNAEYLKGLAWSHRVTGNIRTQITVGMPPTPKSVRMYFLTIPFLLGFFLV